MELCIAELVVAGLGLPEAVCVLVGRFLIDDIGQVCPVEAFPVFREFYQGGEIDFALRLVADGRLGHALFADAFRQRAGIDAGQADDAAFGEPCAEIISGAPVGRRGDGFAEDGAAGRICRFGRGFFLVVGICADISDMREGKEDDLRGVGGIGQDFLIAGDGGVEAQLPHLDTRRPSPETRENRTIFKGQGAGG